MPVHIAQDAYLMLKYWLRQSLKVRWPEIMVLMTLERPMMSSRIAA